MRAIDLFAGAGGASMGIEAAGCEVVQAVELDRLAAIAHRLNLRHVPVHRGDVRGWQPMAADLWWASPPCQAWSSAGAKLGARDERNGWPWVFDALDRAEHRPAWLVCENVRGLTWHTKNCGDAMTCPGCYWEGVVLVEARRRFKSVQVWTLDAADYGVAQHRRRVFLVCGPHAATAPTATHGDGLEPFATMGGALGLRRVIGGGGNPHGKNRSQERNYRDLTDEPSTTVAATQIGNAGPWVEERDDRRRLTVSECATLQDFPAAAVFVGNKGDQYRQVGNAVPPKLAQVVIEAVMRAC